MIKISLYYICILGVLMPSLTSGQIVYFYSNAIKSTLRLNLILIKHIVLQDSQYGTRQTNWPKNAVRFYPGLPVPVIRSQCFIENTLSTIIV